MQLLSCVFVVCVAVVIQLPGQTAATPSPIILLPGVMGSRLEVEDDNIVCSTHHKYKHLWVEPVRLLLNNLCAKRELPLLYDADTNSFQNNTKVKIHVPGFGGTKGVEYLYNGIIDIPYFHEMIEYFVDRGYERGVSIRGAPYDWRLAADELEKRGYFHQLKSLIEDTYKGNSNTKVTLVVHSMGGLNSLHFLTGFGDIDQAWKDKYIHAYVPISAAWNGGVQSLESVISTAYRVPSFLSFAQDLLSKFLVPIARTLESIPWLFPKTSVFGNDVLISTPSKDYTASDYEDLFRKVGYENGYRFFQGIHGLVSDYPAPNVPTYCYYGVGVKTGKKYTYSKDFKPGVSTIGMDAKVTYGDGDGTVNVESSVVCHRWSTMQHSFMYKAFDGASHQGILKESKVLDDIADIVGASKKLKWWEKLFG